MHFNKTLKHIIVWKVVNTILLFLINLLMVRLLGVSKSGDFFYDIAVLSFLVLIISWSLESGIIYYCSKDDRTIPSLVVFVLLLLIIQALISVVVLKNAALIISNYLSVVFVLSNITIIYFSAFFSAKKMFIRFNIISCIVNFITAIILCCCWMDFQLIAIFKNYFTDAYIFSFTVQAFLFVMIILFDSKEIKVNLTKASPLIKNIFTYSSFAFISNIIFFLVVRIDYFFVQKYCSAAALSNYVQVSKCGQLLILIPAIIAGIVFPYSAGSSHDMPLKKVQQLCSTITVIFVPVIILIILTGSWILPWLFGGGFNLMYVTLLLYLPGFFSLSIIAVLAANLAGKKLLNASIVASLMALIIVVALDVLLIPSGGIYAAAIASSLAYIACGLYLLWFYKTKFKCSIADFFSLSTKEMRNISIISKR
jgi:O-antigen/teichoic acid export membrane protein